MAAAALEGGDTHVVCCTDLDALSWAIILSFLAPNARMAVFATCKQLRNLRDTAGVWAKLDLRPNALGCRMLYVPDDSQPDECGHESEISWRWRGAAITHIDLAGEHLRVLDASANKYITPALAAKALGWIEDADEDDEDVFEHYLPDVAHRLPAQLTVLRLHKVACTHVQWLLSCAPPTVGFEKLAADVLSVTSVKDACDALTGTRFPALRFKQLFFDEMVVDSVPNGFSGSLSVVIQQQDIPLLETTL